MSYEPYEGLEPGSCRMFGGPQCGMVVGRGDAAGGNGMVFGSHEPGKAHVYLWRVHPLKPLEETWCYEGLKTKDEVDGLTGK